MKFVSLCSEVHTTGHTHKMCVTEMKMILLLLILTSSAAAFEVEMSHGCLHDVEENDNVTLDWTFNINNRTKLEEMNIYCRHYGNIYRNYSLLYWFSDGVEDSDPVPERFSGRLQVDTDLREGRIRLHVSRFRTEDSGDYWCSVWTNISSDYSLADCFLKVSAAGDQTNTDRLRPEPEPEPEPEPGPGPGPEPEPEPSLGPGPGPSLSLEPEPEPGPDPGGLTGLQIFGVIISVIILFLLFVFVVWFGFIRRKRLNQSSNSVL